MNNLKINIINVPRDENAIKDGAIKLLQAAEAVGLKVEPQGFASAWLSDNMRMAIATDGDKVVGLGALAFGRRYYDEEVSSTILFAKGPARAQLLQFFCDSARVLGASCVYYECEMGDTIGGNPRNVFRLDLE